MAAARLIALHINNSRTLAQCLTDRIGYSMNDEKTDKGRLVSSYACDPRTCCEDFMCSGQQITILPGGCIRTR